MIYLWLIPLLIVLVAAVAFMFRNGTKERAPGSPLDRARSGDLRR